MNTAELGAAYCAAWGRLQDLAAERDRAVAAGRPILAISIALQDAARAVRRAADRIAAAGLTVTEVLA